MARLYAALLVLLVLAPPAHADGRLVHAFDAASEIQSTGNGFAWSTDDGRVIVSDVRGHTRHDVRAGELCDLVDAADSGVVLILCRFEGPSELSDGYLLDARTGALTPRTFEGEPLAVGRWWIETSYNPSDCYHCESQVYTNWHTGERRFGGGDPFEEDVRDLDDPRLGPWRRPYRLRENGSRVLVRRGDRWREVGRCRARCGDPQVWRRRVAYVDPARGELIERRPRHIRRWRVPPGMRDAWLYRAGDALVLADRVGQTWRVWRAVR